MHMPRLIRYGTAMARRHSGIPGRDCSHPSFELGTGVTTDKKDPVRHPYLTLSQIRLPSKAIKDRLLI